MHTANLFYIFAGVGFNLFYIFAGVGFVYLKYDIIYASQCSKAKNCYWLVPKVAPSHLLNMLKG